MTDLYRGKRLWVDRKEYALPNGSKVEKVAVHPGNAVVILPFRADGSCYLIRQYRFVIGEYILEAPAGTLNPGEDPVTAAHRELIEALFIPRRVSLTRFFTSTRRTAYPPPAFMKKTTTRSSNSSG